MARKTVPKKVLIWGGCATRDALPHKEVVSYPIRFMPRSSLASLPSTGTSMFDQQIENYNTASSEKKAFRNDFNSSWNLPAELADTDLLIVDLTAEHHGVFQNKALDSIISRGEIACAIRDDILQAGYQELSGEGRQNGFYDLFEQGAQTFKEIYQQRVQNGGKIKLVLNEIYGAEKFDNWRKTGKWIVSANARLRRVNRIFKRVLEPEHVVTYPVKSLVARRHGHRWGAAPFHFTNDFYEILPRAMWDKLDIVINQQFS